MNKRSLLLSLTLFLAFSVFTSLNAQQVQQFKTSKEKEQWTKTQDSLRIAKKMELVNQPKNNKKQVSDTPRKPVSTQLVNEPGFPPYISTGNKTQDDANYAAAKQKWIQEHPDRYKEMTGNKK
jgi:hypothetical protein